MKRILSSALALLLAAGQVSGAGIGFDIGFGVAGGGAGGGGGGGDVTGPASSLNRQIAVFSGTTGKVITNALPTIGGGGTLDMQGNSVVGLNDMFGETGLQTTIVPATGQFFSVFDPGLTINVIAYNSSTGGLNLRPSATGSSVSLSDFNNVGRWSVTDPVGVNADAITGSGQVRIGDQLITRGYGTGVPFGEALGAAATAIDAEERGTVELAGDAGGNSIETIVTTGFEEGDKIQVRVAGLGGGLTLVHQAGGSYDLGELNLRGADLELSLDSWLLFELNGASPAYWDLIGYDGSLVTPRANQAHDDVVFGDSPYAVAATERMLLVDTTGGAVELDAPSCGGATDGMVVLVKIVAGGSNVTWDPLGPSEEVEGGTASHVFSGALSALSFTCSGTGSNVGWWVY